MVVHLGVQRPPEPLLATVMDYAFKVNALAGHLEREAASTSAAPALTLTPTPMVGLLQR
jgi:hypothetical protein